ncbi:MAG TPA: SUF system Fe-S cluster assembly regulator [Dyella sp.]|nr:SUF system Fe-S cluster assembly regulator [Dyella sp.]
MLRVSRLTDYATVVMTCIAAHPDDVLSTAQIADEAHLELPTVSKLLKSLGHAGLVESFRGVNGGYRLARPAGEINLAEIVEAMEGRIGMTECGTDGQPRARVFALGRRIHHDPALSALRGAPVAAKAGVGRGAVQRQRGAIQGLAGPGEAGGSAILRSHAASLARPPRHGETARMGRSH